MKSNPRLLILPAILIVMAVSVVVSAKTSAPQSLRNTPVPEPTASPTLTPSPTVDQSQPTVIYPTIEPEPTTGFSGDQFTRFPIDPQVVNSIGRLWVSFVNVNDKPATVVP